MSLISLMSRTTGLPDRASRRRLKSLGRAELTLLLRNRTALFTALLMPVIMVVAISGVVQDLDLAEAGLTVGGVLMTGGIGMVLLLVVYSGLTGAYVTRREERVLKRLRTGELSDTEILAGTALPMAAVALAQCVALILAGILFLDLGAPARADLLLIGLALGVVMMVTMAAVTSAFTQTAESAQLTALPLFIVSAVASGLVVPLETLPDRVADIFRLMPLSPVIELVRGGWLGGLDGADTGRALLWAIAWTALGVFAVRRWFRWDPRR